MTAPIASGPRALRVGGRLSPAPHAREPGCRVGPECARVGKKKKEKKRRREGEFYFLLLLYNYYILSLEGGMIYVYNKINKMKTHIVVML